MIFSFHELIQSSIYKFLQISQNKMEMEPKVIRIVNLQSNETNESLINFLNYQLQLQGKIENIYIGHDKELSLVFAYVIFEFSCDATRTVKDLFDLDYKSLKLDVSIISPNVAIKIYTSSQKKSSPNKTCAQKHQSIRSLRGSKNSFIVSKEQKQKVLDSSNDFMAKLNKKIAAASSLMNIHLKQSPNALGITNTPVKPQKNNKTNKDRGATRKNSSIKSVNSGLTPQINFKTDGLLNSRNDRSDSFHVYDDKIKTTELSKTSHKHQMKSENLNKKKGSRLALSTIFNNDAHLLRSSVKVATVSNNAKSKLQMPEEKLSASEKSKSDKKKYYRSLKYAKKKPIPSSVKKNSADTVTGPLKGNIESKNSKIKQVKTSCASEYSKGSTSKSLSNNGRNSTYNTTLFDDEGSWVNEI